MSNTKVTTGEVRFSFPHVFQPHANNPGQEEKYSVTILIPKTDTATIDAIQAAMQAAAQEGVSTKFNGQMPAMLEMGQDQTENHSEKNVKGIWL